MRRHRLAHVDDDSNADPRFARNRLRLDGLAGPEEAFPAAEAVARRRRALGAGSDRHPGRSGRRRPGRDLGPGLARHRGLAGAARRRGRATSCVPGCAARRAGRRRPAWSSGSRARSPSADRCAGRSMAASCAATAAVSATSRSWPPRAVRRGAAAATERGGRDDRSQPSRSFTSSPAGTARSRSGRSRRAASLSRWRPASRCASVGPGDRFQAGVGRPPRSLKLQFQAAGLPAWQRARSAAQPATACRSSSPGSASMPAPWLRRGSRSWPWPGGRADRIVGSLFIGRPRPSLRETACSGRQQAPSSWH